ncbi:DUF4124 domain-containing protein [Comamonas sp. NLF-1-9]|uniref:DUF4124 domain-containing protein n=1 Tax=Comamonas sp. NLF-1-9 TaxID=2853163 RepID=UPI001C4505EB|nr:DUF4124 domain-containing protein [Comamonas sp. NLF-1-9]QXL83891.1 DUF4124 domain-containing protein [Comamonas sp. NLF-1-9]
MLSRGERITWAALAVLVLAGAAAAWYTRAAWLPGAGPWLEQLWRKSTRPGPETLPPGKRAAGAGARSGSGAEPPPPPPRKCLTPDGRVVYTNQPCPAGTREQALDGALSVLPSGPGGAAPQPRP